ncbi:MAG: glycosyltransferase [Clostridia bacterium]|nr:glycosyltransferase [Clostridia bacterium]
MVDSIEISLIVPAYNVENTIENCINSILGQTLKNIEVIVVDDASTDSTAEILRTIHDERVVLLRQEHLGQGAARNYGMSKARGSYIGFVDGDDTVENCMYEKMLKCAKANNAEIVQCNINDIFPDGTSAVQMNVADAVVTKKDAHRYFIKYFYKNLHSYEVCNKTFRTSFVKSRNLFFESNDLVYAEDLLFNLEAALYLHRIAFMKEAYYNYFQCADSHSKTYSSAKVKKFCALFSLFFQKHEDAPRPETDAVALLILMTNIARTEGEKKEIRALCRRSDIREYIRGSRRCNPRFLHKFFMNALLYLPMSLRVALIKSHYRIME